MAKTGTKVPSDAGKQNIIPSVPRPDQRVESDYFTKGGILKPSLPTAADNPTDIPRSTADRDTADEVITGTGDSLPPGVNSKRANMATDVPNVPGDSRDMKHQKANPREFDKFVGENDLKSRADTGKVGIQQVCVFLTEKLSKQVL